MADDLNFDFEVQLNARDAVNRELNKVRKMGHDSSMAQMAQSNGNAPRHGKSNFRQIVCRHWLRGLCMKGDDCTFLHQAIPEKMPICQYFSRFGECHQPDCPFKHIEEEVKECYMYKLGWCINGPYCRYRHVKLPGPPPSILETIKLRLPSVAGGGATVHHRPVPKEGGGWTTERPEDRRARDQRAFGGQRVHRPPPPSYVCHLCRIPGHWKQQCPTLNKGGEGGEDGGGKGSYGSDRPAKRARYDSGGYQQQQSQQAAQPTAQQQQTSQQLGGWGAQPVGQQAAQQPAQQPQQQWGSQPARGPPAPQQSQPQLGGWGAKPVGQHTMPPPSHPPQQGGYYR